MDYKKKIPHRLFIKIYNFYLHVLTLIYKSLAIYSKVITMQKCFYKMSYLYNIILLSTKKLYSFLFRQETVFSLN